MTPLVSDVLRQQVADCSQDAVQLSQSYEGVGDIPIGTACKNNSCKQVTCNQFKLSQMNDFACFITL